MHRFQRATNAPVCEPGQVLLLGRTAVEEGHAHRLVQVAGLNDVCPLPAILHTWQMHAFLSLTPVVKIVVKATKQSVFWEAWCPDNIAKLQVWPHKSSEVHFMFS